MFSVKNLNILFFGGTGELGSHVALELSFMGAKVTIVGRSKEKGEDIIRRSSGVIEFIQFDALKDTNEKEIISTYVKENGKIDVLVNASGINSATPFEDITPHEIKSIMRVNYELVSNCCAEALIHMKEQKSGSIINFGSISGITPLSRVYTYSASKGALHNLTKNIAREYGKYGIRINTLVPGFFPAEQNKKILSEDRIKTIIDHTPMGRFGSPEDLYGPCIFLCSPASLFVTGTEIVVDGGFNATKI